MSNLPASVLDLVEFTPMEDLALAVLRDGLPEVNVASLVRDGQKWPLVLVRRVGDWGRWQGDRRFVDVGQLTVHVYCDGIDADSDCALLSDAVRVVLNGSVNKPFAGLGYFTNITMTSSARRVTDWATATGPVQYADLPTGVARYESVYEVAIRAA